MITINQGLMDWRKDQTIKRRLMIPEFQFCSKGHMTTVITVGLRNMGEGAQREDIVCKLCSEVIAEGD